MATLVFVDGKTAEVPYEKAALIYQVLIGNKEPEDTAQADYVANVKEVIFPKISQSTKTAVVADPNRHARLEAIKNDKSLKGKAVFDAVRKVLTNTVKKNEE